MKKIFVVLFCVIKICECGTLPNGPVKLSGGQFVGLIGYLFPTDSNNNNLFLPQKNHQRGLFRLGLQPNMNYVAPQLIVYPILYNQYQHDYENEIQESESKNNALLKTQTTDIEADRSKRERIALKVEDNLTEPVETEITDSKNDSLSNIIDSTEIPSPSTSIVTTILPSSIPTTAIYPPINLLPLQNDPSLSPTTQTSYQSTQLAANLQPPNYSEHFPPSTTQISYQSTQPDNLHSGYPEHYEYTNSQQDVSLISLTTLYPPRYDNPPPFTYEHRNINDEFQFRPSPEDSTPIDTNIFRPSLYQPIPFYTNYLK